jgi:hypothetical protein
LNDRSGEKTDYAGHVTFAPLEFGAVKGGVLPGWSATVHPLEIDFFGSATVPSELPGNHTFHRFSAGGFGGRLYLLSHFVRGKRSREAIVPMNSGLIPTAVVGTVNTVTNWNSSTVFYQVAAVGAEVKVAPLALGILGNAPATFYDGFGEAALFANASIPHRLGASIEVRGGGQWAVATGGTIFLRVEMAIGGSRARAPTQDEINAQEDPNDEEAPKWR